MYCGILPRYFTIAIFSCVPMHTASCIQSRAVFLHNNTCNNIFKWPRQPLQFLKARSNNTVRPFVDFFDIKCMFVQRIHYGNSHYLLHVFNYEFSRVVLVPLHSAEFPTVKSHRIVKLMPENQKIMKKTTSNGPGAGV